MVFLLPAWANRPKEYKLGGMVHSKADGGEVGKYGSSFLTWKADGTADMDRPLRGMADGGNVNYTIQPGTPFYNYFNSLRGNKIGA